MQQVQDRFECLAKCKAVLDQAVAKGQLPADTDTHLAAHGAFAFVSGLMRDWVETPDTFELEGGRAAIDRHVYRRLAREPAAANRYYRASAMTEPLLDDQSVYWVLWLNTLLHELGVPVPMTPTALVAGARAVTGTVSPLLLIVMIVAGMVIGNAAWFAAGRRYGSAVLKLLCRVSISPDTCVARTEGTFGRWGWSALVIGRFLPGVTLVAPPLAGALGMKWSTFLALTVAGSALFGLVVVGAGMLLYEQIDFVLQQLVIFGWEAVGILAVLLALYIGWRWWRRRIALAIGVPRIDVQELRALIDAGEPIELIDVRGRNANQLDQRQFRAPW